jgi:proteic killer suppression protein
MEVEFKDDSYARLETDAPYTADFSSTVVSMYRRRVQFIRSAHDERDFYAMRSLHFEKLKGDRKHQFSMRLNDQWRLIMELHSKGARKTVLVVQIEDYH